MTVNRNKKRARIGYFVLTILSCAFFMTFTACGGGGSSNGSPVPPPQEPSVTGVNPAVSATEIGMDTQVQATFDVAMDPATINTGTFTLASPSGSVNGTVSYDTETKTATFTPAYSLAPLTSYTATLTGVMDTDGHVLRSPYSWSFLTVTGFWAYDFDSFFDQYYFASATLAGESTHCLIYLENGQFVDPATISEIAAQFDNAIYTNEVSVFGDEPNPGIDGNPKIFIFLLDIRDGYTPNSESYVAGYFNPLDEYAVSTLNPYSNQKELFNMDIYPGKPGDEVFVRTLAHEFQHMISWNQKTNIRGVYEDTWLDEAMSEVAPLFCNYAPDYSRVMSYQLKPWDSLVDWSGDISDYSTAYMWSQYMKDRVQNTDASGHNVFWNINHTATVGINAVNTALAAVGSGKDFTDIFRDWSLANYLGVTTIPGHPEWSYTSIHTEAGYPIGDSTFLPGLPRSDSDHMNTTTVGGLHLWGLDYFQFTKTGNGTVTWTKTNPTDEAAFIDLDDYSVIFSMTSGTPYSYTDSAILIARNPTGSEKWTVTGGGTMTFTSVRGDETLMGASLYKRSYGYQESPTPATPKELLLQISSDPMIKILSGRTGRPVSVCVDHFFREREKALREDVLKNKTCY